MLIYQGGRPGSFHRKVGYWPLIPHLAPTLVCSEFQRGEEIGTGKFSVMRKAIWKKGGMEVAIKDLQNREKFDVSCTQAVIGSKPTRPYSYRVYWRTLFDGGTSNIPSYTLLLRRNRLGYRDSLFINIDPTAMFWII